MHFLGVSRRFPVDVLLVAIGLGTTTLGADEASRSTHRLPLSIREAIAEGLPRYDPDAGAGTQVEIARDEATVNSADVLVLPKMTVRQRMKAPLNAIEWLTPKGRMALALKRYPGVKIGNIFGLNNAGAVARLNEQIESDRKNSLKQRVNDLNQVADDPDLRKELKRALARPNLQWAGEK